MSDLPQGWERATLAELCNINPRSFDITPGDDDFVSVVPMAAVDAESGLLNAGQVIEYGLIKSKSLTRFQEGDVLFAKITPCMENGKMAVAKGLHGGRAVGSTEFHILRSHGNLLPDYLRYYLLQKRVRYDAERNMTGAVGQRRVPRSHLENLLLPVPPLNEQRRIVAVLEDHLSRTDAGESSLDSAQQRAGRARTALAREIVDSHREADRTPLGSISTDQRYGTSVKCSYNGSGPPVLRIPNVQSGQIELSDLKYATITSNELHNLRIRQGDVLFVRTNGSRSLIGRSAVAERDLDYAFASYLIRFRFDPSLVYPYWIRLVLDSPQLRREVEMVAASSAGQYNLNISKLSGLRIPLPPIGVQIEIVNAARNFEVSFERMLSEAHAIRQRAKVLRHSLLAAAFAGQLTSQDPSDEPASVLLERIRTQRASATTIKRTRGMKVAAQEALL